MSTGTVPTTRGMEHYLQVLTCRKLPVKAVCSSRMDTQSVQKLIAATLGCGVPQRRPWLSASVCTSRRHARGGLDPRVDECLAQPSCARHPMKSSMQLLSDLNRVLHQFKRPSSCDACCIGGAGHLARQSSRRVARAVTRSGRAPVAAAAAVKTPEAACVTPVGGCTCERQ